MPTARLNDAPCGIFGIQLEVTSLLLEAERRKLNVLQRELQITLTDGGSLKEKEYQRQELLVLISKIQIQYEHLEKEYRQHVLEAFICSNQRRCGKRIFTIRGMMQKPTIRGPKPVVPTKPKLIPPVNTIKVTATGEKEIKTVSLDQFKTASECVPKMYTKPATSENKTYNRSTEDDDQNVMTYPISLLIPGDVDKSTLNQTYSNQSVDKKKFLAVGEFPVGPSSPNTVCCSILPNTSTADCCNVLNATYKKELAKKSEHFDSVSNDSGGFKEYVNSRTVVMKQKEDTKWTDAKENYSGDYQNYQHSNQPNQYNQVNQHYPYDDQMLNASQKLQQEWNQQLEEKQREIKQHLEHTNMLTNQELWQKKADDHQKLCKQLLDENEKWHKDHTNYEEPQITDWTIHKHQRKSSQPEFFNHKNLTLHQRKVSQPELWEHSVADRLQMFNQNLDQQNRRKMEKESDLGPLETRHLVSQKQNLFNSQFQMSGHSSNSNSNRDISHAGGQPTLSQKIQMKQKLLLGQSLDKSMDKGKEVGNVKQQNGKQLQPNLQTTPPIQMLPQGHIQQSQKKLEELFSQRAEKDKALKLLKGGVITSGNGKNEPVVVVQKQIQDKLQKDLKEHVKQIRDQQSIEYRWPQNRQVEESNRSQPAIGLKHPSKSRVERHAMDDAEIQETVESILGKHVKVIDCEKKSSIKEEEVLLINGHRVSLNDQDGETIKEALRTGQIPPSDLLNTVLIKAGILRAPVKLETSLSVKTSLVTKEQITVAKAGKVVDERSRETKEDNFYTSDTTEVWEPMKVTDRNDLPKNCLLSNCNSNSNYTSSGSSFPPPETKVYDCLRSDSNVSNSYLDKQSSTDSSSSSYESDEQSPVFMKSPKVEYDATDNRNQYLFPTSISRDSGNDLSNSMSRSSTTFVAGGKRNGNTFTPTSVSSLSSLDENDFVGNLPEVFRNGCDIRNGYQPYDNILPSIFGTITSDLTPKDGSNRRSIPQTPQGSNNFQNSCNGNEAENEGVSEKLPNSEYSIDKTLIYRDGNLISGSLQSLIQHMVPTEIYYPDRAYIFAFLLSCRLFIKPHELIVQICSICDSQQNLHLFASIYDPDASDSTIPEQFISGQSTPGQMEFARNLTQLLIEWTETFPYDFRDDRVMKHLSTIAQNCVMIHPQLRHDVDLLFQNLMQMLSKLNDYENNLEKLTKNGRDVDANLDITEVCPSPGTLAHQLTHIELERLSFIGPEEFVQAFAKENPNLETSFKDMKKTRNLESYIQWFNRLSYFVATEVCKHQKKKQRVKVIEYWIETARECFCIGNFNSLMSIIAGLNMSPISRLKKTVIKLKPDYHLKWSKIQTDKFSVLEHQMDPTSNFSSYRSTLKAAMWRSAGARDERQRIVIPFFSLLVKDLYFLNEGCSNKLPNGHINFDKFWQLAKQVTEFMTWKQVTCPFEKNPRLIAILQESYVLNENTLTLASFECEPPENSQEKDRFKSLKTELNSTL